ncbi:MAG: uroporphyrinogen-III synthase [Gammaproteobacteria bacterium]|nr:MAG: uroporphyrinogen-III synthase [Gammaproteobacteria bacterium]
MGPTSSERCVLLTRSPEDNAPLATAFDEAGIETREMPLMRPRARPLEGENRQRLLDLDQYTHVIAVSKPAARALAEAIDTWWPQVPLGLHWYAPGAGTAGALEDALGVRVKTGSPPTSEGLLALAELQNVAGEKVLIARGEAGRELLAETLRARGAQVDYLPLYGLVQPDYDETTLSHAFAPGLTDVLALSARAWQRLSELARQAGFDWDGMRIWVPSRRVAESVSAPGAEVKVLAALDTMSVVSQIQDTEPTT